MFISGTQNIDFYSNIKLGVFFTATKLSVSWVLHTILVLTTSAEAKGNKEERCVSGKGQDIPNDFLHYLV